MKGIVLAVDPGNIESAYVFLWHTGVGTEIAIGKFGKVPNEELLNVVQEPYQHLAVEVPRPRGRTFWQLVGTTVWAGRFIQASGRPFTDVNRADVKRHVGKSGKAKDKDIRAAVIARWGGESAIGKKGREGPLYGVSNDVWQAIGVGITYLEGGCVSPSILRPNSPRKRRGKKVARRSTARTSAR